MGFPTQLLNDLNAQIRQVEGRVKDLKWRRSVLESGLQLSESDLHRWRIAMELADDIEVWYPWEKFLRAVLGRERDKRASLPPFALRERLLVAA